MQTPRGKNEGGIKEICPTITGKAFKDNNHVVERCPLKFLERNQKNVEGDYAFTVDTANTGGIREGSRVRRLTPKECERLMGLPDDWTKDGIQNGKLVSISDSQRYKLCGNGVVVNVVEEIIKNTIL